MTVELRNQLVPVMMRALCEHHHGVGDASCDEEQWGDSYIEEEMHSILGGVEAAGFVIIKREPRVSPLPHDPLTGVHCFDCGEELFAHELFYYGNACEQCERKRDELLAREDD